MLGKSSQINKPGKFIYVLESCRFPFCSLIHAQRLVPLFLGGEFFFRRKFFDGSSGTFPFRFEEIQKIHIRSTASARRNITSKEPTNVWEPAIHQTLSVNRDWPNIVPSYHSVH